MTLEKVFFQGPPGKCNKPGNSDSRPFSIHVTRQSLSLLPLPISSRIYTLLSATVFSNISRGALFSCLHNRHTRWVAAELKATSEEDPGHPSTVRLSDPHNRPPFFECLVRRKQFWNNRGKKFKSIDRLKVTFGTEWCGACLGPPHMRT